MHSTLLLFGLYLLHVGIQQSSAAPNDITTMDSPTPETTTTSTLTTLVATSESTQSTLLNTLSQTPPPETTAASVLVSRISINIKRVKDIVKKSGQDDYNTEKKTKIRTILRNQNVKLLNTDKRGKQKLKLFDYTLDKQEKMKPKTRTFGALFALAALTGINPLANPFQFISPGRNTLNIITVYRRRFPFFVDPVYYYDTNYAYYDDYGNYDYNNYDNAGGVG